MESLIMYLSYATFNSFNNYSDYKKNLGLLDEDLKNLEHQYTKLCSKNVESDELLLPYFNYLKENIKTSNLFNLYKNLETLEIEKNNKIILIGNIGSYSPKENKIKYINKKCLGHELLHVASACNNDKNNIQVGFSLLNNNGKLGTAINEGYTDHLSEEFFNHHAKAYNDVRKIASYTEELIGKERMQDLYFNNNLLGLFKELEKFMTREDAIKLIALQDSMLNAKVAANIYYKKPAHEINKILDKSFKQKALIK